MLRNVSLEKYLALSNRNYAVLCDYVIMEAYKAENPVQSILDSMQILSRYPDQVLILKNAIEICNLNGRSSGLQSRLICQRQTKEFQTFCRKIKALKNNWNAIERSIYEHSRAAKSRIDSLEKEYENLPQKFYELEGAFSQKELQIIRTKSKYTLELSQKVIKFVMELSAYVFEQHPNVHKLPDFDNLHNTYIFRNSLYHYVLILEWMSSGGMNLKSPKSSSKLRNDIVDIHIITYASFFDGIMTNEKKMINRYKTGKFIIDGLAGMR